MSRWSVRVAGALLGSVTMLGAGALAGSWWWLPALGGAVSAVGAVVDRQLAYAQVLAVLALGVGLAVEGALWSVPLLVGGVVASIELGAAADTVTIVRPRVPRPVASAGAALLAVVVSAIVLVLGELPVVAAAGSVVVAAAAAVVATRVLAR